MTGKTAPDRPPVVGGIRAADHRVPRAWPCCARNLPPLPPAPCGATPTRPYRRTCPQGHDSRVHLCGPHAMILLAVPCCCGPCADRGGVTEATFTPDPGGS